LIESLTSFKRAGADMIFTYAAPKLQSFESINKKTVNFDGFFYSFSSFTLDSSNALFSFSANQDIVDSFLPIYQ
jgi:hypothetical protein